MQSGPEKRQCAAHFTIKNSVTHLFPYINSKIENSLYYENPEYIKFFYKTYICYLHPDKGTAGPFDSEDEANTIIKELMELLLKLDGDKTSIKPNFRKHKPVPVMDIFKILPGTNCTDCNFPTCMAFAASVSLGDTNTVECPHIVNPIEEKMVYPIFDNDGNIVKRVEIDADSSKLFKEIKRQEKYIKKLEKNNPDRSLKTTGFSGLYTGELTPRELEVLKYVAEGLTNNKISNELSISPHTVKSHIIHIFNKLGVNDRTQAAVWAAKNQIV
jgi:DNA-binding CsgD family transcriptional regulator/ArsR family metal-binding transcriptional regulator